MPAFRLGTRLKSADIPPTGTRQRICWHRNPAEKLPAFRLQERGRIFASWGNRLQLPGPSLELPVSPLRFSYRKSAENLQAFRLQELGRKSASIPPIGTLSCKILPYDIIAILHINCKIHWAWKNAIRCFRHNWCRIPSNQSINQQSIKQLFFIFFFFAQLILL